MNHLTLGFIGFGLIGGSIARVLKKKSAPVDILVYSRRKNPALDTGVEEGVSYELFIQIDQIPASSGGLLISNGNGGGTNLAIRGSQGQVNFNVGSTQQDGTYSGSGYIYAQPTEASEGKKIEAGKLVHLVGIYDPVGAKVSLYYDGELASEGEFGAGDFKMAGTKSGALGIAYNASFTSECLGNLTPFSIVKARVYRQPLTAEEVKTVYENCVALVSPAESK